jgi:hypothetical protein
MLMEIFVNDQEKEIWMLILTLLVLSSCQGTLADNSKDDCILTTAETCTQSGVFTGSTCLFRIVPASFMVRCPGYFVCDFDTTFSGYALGISDFSVLDHEILHLNHQDDSDDHYLFHEDGTVNYGGKYSKE